MFFSASPSLFIDASVSSQRPAWLARQRRQDVTVYEWSIESPSCKRQLSKPTTGNLAVKCLGRASCACPCLHDAVADERLWMALWEGPVPEGFPSGGKAAHAALWLLAKGEVEQVGGYVCTCIVRACMRGGALVECCFFGNIWSWCVWWPRNSAAPQIAFPGAQYAAVGLLCFGVFVHGRYAL